MPMTQLVVAALAILLVETPAATASGQELPAGWIYLEREPYDTTPGAYHDSVSGAFVRSEAVAGSGIVKPWTAGKSKTAPIERGVVFGRRFERVETPGSGPGCKKITISMLFAPEGEASWNFEADVCTARQRERVEDLVLRSLSSQMPGPNQWNRSGKLRTADLKSIPKGRPWQQVREALGPPEDAKARANGGFLVEYTVERRTFVLAFGKDRSFVSLEERPD